MRTKYCVIETPNYNGKKCAPAQVIKEFSTRKAAGNSDLCLRRCSILTLRQAERIIKKWNAEFWEGNYESK